MTRFILLLIVTFSKNFVQTIELTEVIQTNKGSIQGRVLTTAERGIKYSAFKAIPYAKPPVDYRRFQPPEENNPWTDVLLATNEPSVCPQWNDEEKRFIGDEDCLYLNVYTPKINSVDRSQRAVMVWIYGGAFVTGYINSSFYGPDFLIEDDVVVVAINYRLGALGFLSLNHQNATGNVGLKDQNLGLQWVQQNIHLFGGDPKKVTIFGQSAGAASVELHKLSDLSVGLFQGSIAMSGSPLNIWAFHTPEEAQSRAFNLGSQLGVFTFSENQLLQKLYSASAQEIVMATSQMTLLDLPFKPTIEDPTIAINPFLTDCTVNKYRSGNFSQLPHILGFTRLETVSFAYSVLRLEQMINLALESTAISNVMSQLRDIDTFRDFIDDTRSNIGNLTEDAINRAINVTTDLLFIVGIDRTQKYLVAQSSAPVYFYRNSFDYDYALHKVQGVYLNGTGHSDDLASIFWIENNDQSLDPSSDIGIQRKKMVRMWTNFAKYGDPTPNGTADPLLNITWPPSGSEGHHLEINREYSIEDRYSDNLVMTIESVADSLRGFADGCLSFSSSFFDPIKRMFK